MEKTKVVAKKQGIGEYLTAPLVKQQIANVVGKTNSTRFISSIISAVQNNPKLQDCTQKSILNSALLGETLDLSPSSQLGQYYMVPFDKKGTLEAVFQLGYKGYLQLAIRSGEYKKFTVLPIKEGELVKWNALEEEIEVNLIDDEDKRSKATTIGYYGMFELNNGFRKAMYWSFDKMLTHAEKYSKGFNAKKGYTFWETDFDSMACKTLIRQLISKWGVMSVDMQRAYKADMGVISSDIKDSTTDFEVDYVDNPQVDIDEQTGEVIETELITDSQKKLIFENFKNIDEIVKYFDKTSLDELTHEEASQVLSGIKNKK